MISVFCKSIVGGIFFLLVKVISRFVIVVVVVTCSAVERRWIVGCPFMLVAMWNS